MKRNVGVIVGRFQIAELHAGHRYLIDTALSETDSVIIFVGVHGGQPTERNPLSFTLREAMLKETYPQAIVRPIYDTASDEFWSKELDRLIAAEASDCVPVLYGSRDSFLKSYQGAHKRRYVNEVPGINATAIRQQHEVVNNPDFLKGVIYAAMKQRFPTMYPVIDVAVRHGSRDEILLGRKRDEALWRFAGGFVDPTDTSLEAAVRREVKEEMGGIEVSDIRYLGSHIIDDHRYRGSVDGIMSSFFLATYQNGEPKGEDDLAEVRWFPRQEIMDHLIPTHQPLGKLLLQNW